ncbi:MAG: DUF2807 domain-containing protein [Flavobacteriales bacterium]|nr:DUF2807 domain-containing protein [Flavobacteriales bacterium]
MKNIFSLLIALVLLSSCGETITGDGNVTTEERAIDSYNTLDVSGVFEIVLMPGEPKVVIETDENIHEHIDTKVEGGTLHITANNKILDAEALLLTVYYRDIDEVSISGACELASSGAVTGDRLELDISGGAEAELALDVDFFSIDLSGAAELEVRGLADKVEFDLSGAAEISAFDLQVKEAYIDISGASEVEISVSEVLEVEISGAGQVDYKGDPNIKSDISGAGSLNKR